MRASTCRRMSNLRYLSSLWPHAPLSGSPALQRIAWTPTLILDTGTQRHFREIYDTLVVRRSARLSTLKVPSMTFAFPLRLCGFVRGPLLNSAPWMTHSDTVRFWRQCLSLRCVNVSREDAKPQRRAGVAVKFRWVRKWRGFRGSGWFVNCVRSLSAR